MSICTLRAVLSVAAALPLLAAGAPHSAQFQARPKPAQASAGPTRIWIRNATLYPYRDAPARVLTLSGSVVPMTAGRPIVFDNIASYGVLVSDARMTLGPAALAVLMNRYVLPTAKAPIRDVGISFNRGTIGMTGTLVRGAVHMRFTAVATPSATTGGDLRLHITRMRAAGFLPKGLMDALGLTMQRVAEPRHPDVVQIVQDDMIVPVVSMFPPPKFGARVRSVTVTPQAFTVALGEPGAGGPAPLDAASFIAYRHGTVRFARLTMSDTDLTLLPGGNGSVGFSPAAYYRQLEAGVTFNRPGGALVARVPDYRALPGGPSVITRR